MKDHDLHLPSINLCSIQCHPTPCRARNASFLLCHKQALACFSSHAPWPSRKRRCPPSALMISLWQLWTLAALIPCRQASIACLDMKVGLITSVNIDNSICHVSYVCFDDYVWVLGLARQKSGELCALHKEQGIVDVSAPRCRHPSGCELEPRLHYKGVQCRCAWLLSM